MNTSILTKKNYNSKRVKDEEKRERDYKQFEIIDKKKKKIRVDWRKHWEKNAKTITVWNK